MCNFDHCKATLHMRHFESNLTSTSLVTRIHRMYHDNPYFFGSDSNLLIVFYVQIMPDDFVMQLHRF
ncbi:hypothetical protein DQW89_27475 (plasmid) [Escherichia coli]|nr:hypothetical protein DQW89_27475 [Escherichia coli]